MTDDPTPTTLTQRAGRKIVEWRWWITAAVAAILLISAAFVPDWPDITGFDGKTIWDLLELVVVPAVLAFGVWWLNDQARKREEAAELRQKEQTIKQLVLQLGSSAPGVALDALRQLSFLTPLSQGILQGVDLQGAKLSGASLREANLEGTDLQGADLQGADLRRANLRGINLQGTRLGYARLREANLQEANLKNAELTSADLRGANLQGANLLQTTLLMQAKYNDETVFPAGFHPGIVGMKFVK